MSQRGLINAVLVVLIVSLAGGLGCSTSVKEPAQPTQIPMPTPTATPSPTPTAPPDASIEYRNDQYGFGLTLPGTWKGYDIVVEKWAGSRIVEPQGEVLVEQGPQILIRHPKSTPQNPRQDIPIMVFTLDQWNSLQEGKFHVSAGPLNPRELGRNRRYVFAVQARYNYAFPEGWQEVAQILRGRPLRTFEPAEHTNTASQNGSPVAVAFVSETQGWVIAGDCADSGDGRCSVLATRDGGKTWREQYSTAMGLRELYAIDPDCGWLLGSSSQSPDGPWSSTLLATTDGGQTWKPRWAGDGALSGLQFLDDRHGWVLAMVPVAIEGTQHRGHGRELRKTTDGGSTWITVPIAEACF